MHRKEEKKRKQSVLRNGSEGRKGKLHNWKLTLMYDGSHYQGWQRLGKEEKQEKDGLQLNTIQGILEEILSKQLQEKISVIGSGRTDSGVHALGQVANFHTNQVFQIEEVQEKRKESQNNENHTNDILTEQWKKSLNDSLPEDIRVIDLEEVETEFHSRYNAVLKRYEYHLEVGERPSVFCRKYAAWIEGKLEIELMRKAAEYFLGEHDFKGFASEMKDGRGTEKTIYGITIEQQTKNHIVIAIAADGFLYHMVRIIVGTLVEIGLGNKQPEVILEIFETKNRQLAGYTIEGKGLFLQSVEYTL